MRRSHRPPPQYFPPPPFPCPSTLTPPDFTSRPFHRVPFHMPPPYLPSFTPFTPSSPIVQPKTDNIETLLHSWISRMEPVLLERIKQRTNSAIQIPSIRLKLARWIELTDLAESSQVHPSIQEELVHLEEQCTKDGMLDSVQEKLRKINKKRRYLKRRRERIQRSQSENAIVCRSSVSATLELLRSTLNTHLPEEDSLSKDGTGECEQFGNSRVETSKTSLQKDRLVNLTKQLNSIDDSRRQLKERLALLDASEKLRSARLSQARQQGGLFPEALDLAFSAQIAELRNTLKSQLGELEQLQTRLQPQNGRTRQIVKDKPGEKSGNAEKLVCCDHLPGLTQWEKHLVFGSESEQPDVPWRWKRFYHQADFDFADFVRIRSEWDAYLVSDSTSEKQCTDELTEPSPILTTWTMPPEDLSPEWRTWVEKVD